MSVGSLFLPGAGWPRVMLGVVLQVTGVVGVAAVVAGVCFRRRAAARHGVWLGALVWVVLSPAVALVAERSGLAIWRVGPPAVRVLDAAAAPAGAVDLAAETTAGVVEDRATGPAVAAAVATTDASDGEEAGGIAGSVGPVPPSSRGSVPGPPARRVPDSRAGRESLRAAAPRRTVVDGSWLVALWGLGVLLGIVRVAFGWFRLNRLLRAARPLDAGRHAESVAQARDALGGAALPPVVTSPGLAGPIAAGVLRPRVVLPVGIEGALDGPALRDVLIHECAHALRGDTRVGLLQRLAAVFFWPHPLVHVLNVQLDRAREEVCDNHVLACGDPCGYARTLLSLTELCRPHGPARAGMIGLLTARWTLTDRVAGLLDPRRVAMTRMTNLGRFAVAAVLAAAGLTVAGVRFDRTTRAAAPDPPAPVPAADAPKPEGPGRQVRGVVVDEAGQPVAGVVVRVVFAWKAPAGAVTAADGAFSLTLRGRMLLQEDLVAEADGGLRSGLGRFEEPLDSRPAEPVRIVLKPSRPLTVHVKDAAGAAVAGAAVAAVAFDYAFSAEAVTDAEGSATLRIPADATVRWVVALKAGVGFDYFENYRSRGGVARSPRTPEVRLTLDGARTVRVKAVDSAGRPVSGVVFLPWEVTKPGKIADANLGSGMNAILATTGADGVAEFPWLPKRIERSLSFFALSEEYSCPALPSDEGTEGQELTARLLRRTRLSGTVRHADGRPAAGVLIHAEGRGLTNMSGHLYARTRPDGTYSGEVDPEQSYIVAVIDGHWAARSHTDVIVREGRPEGGLDFALTRGTLIRGRVTEKPEDRPVSGLHVSLSQERGPLPAGLRKGDRGDGDPSLLRFVETDADGRYAFRVGPGRFVLRVPSAEPLGPLTTEGDEGPDIVRDVSLPGAATARTIRGVVVEKAPAGDRPVPGAIVEAAAVGRRRPPVRTIADAKGHFVLEQPGGRYTSPGSAEGPLVLHARDVDGRIAGFTHVSEADAAEVTAYVSEASRVTGRVVDGAGRPRARWPLSARLGDGPDSNASARFSRHFRTDDQGRFTLDGVAVGARGQVEVRDIDEGSRYRAESFHVRGTDPVELPDLVFVTEPVAAAPAPRPAAAEPAAREEKPEAASAWPSRAEIEDMIRGLGRDPVSRELVDRVSLLFRPQNPLARDLGRTRKRLADPEFVRRIDAAAEQASGRPATALELIRWAMRPLVGDDDAMLAHRLRIDAAESRRDPVSVWGVVLDGRTGRPVAGARVATSIAITETAANGRFALLARPPADAEAGRPPSVRVEADGFALREAPLQLAPQHKHTLQLLPAAAFEGRVLDDRGRPVAGAVVSAWIARDAVTLGNLGRSGGNAVVLTVRSDDRGWFSVRGIPPSPDPVHLRVSHPEYRSVSESRVAPTTPDDPCVVRLTPGCVVTGVVVDAQGRPVAGAAVEVRKPYEPGAEHEAQSDGAGRFRFHNVNPGWWDLFIQSDRHAASRVRVEAAPGRPAETQVVLSPGGSISGKVVGPDGAPVAGAAVGWVDSIGVEFQNLARMTCTAADGTFELGPLPPDEFRITALADSPRRLGKVTARTNRTGVVIRLAPDPVKPPAF